MPISNGNGQFSVGRDISLVLMGPFGRVDLPNVMKFDCKQDYADIKLDRLDGVQMNAALPKGWSGTIEVERGSPGVDLLFAAMEQGWLSGGVYQVSSLYTYIVEANGSTSTFQFDNVSLKLSDGGSWSGDASVRQRIEFMANRRRSV